MQILIPEWMLDEGMRIAARGWRLWSVPLCQSPQKHLRQEVRLMSPPRQGSADGRSLWATAFTTSETTSGLWTTGFSATGAWTLLKVDLSGNVAPMLRESKMNLGWAIPSPDGTKLAIWKASGTSNVWLAERE
jgi:hypothetical protein